MSSWYAWRERTRCEDIRACGAHSGTSNTDTKLLINGLFQKGGVLAQDGVAPSDPWTLLAISVALGGVAFGACLLPGLRATRIDPLIALRDS